MLKEIKVSIDDLLLDPNNPRFKKDLTESIHVKDDSISDSQKEVLKNFSTNPSSDDENDVTNISDLYESMRTIGFVPIDRIVVRSIQGSSQYLVIEGNRRISTIKTMLHDYERRVGVFDKSKEREKYEAIKDSFDNIVCMYLETKGVPEEEVRHKISIILGLRHHGSLLEWEALPKAYNIYKEYMNIEPRLRNFDFDNKKRNEVSSRLSISRANVSSALKTYVAYLQLSEHYDVKDRHYSLIQAVVTNKYLQGSFITVDSSKYKLDEASMERMNLVCQFSNRDKLTAEKKKILEDPKKVTLLGKLYNKKQKATHDAVKAYADDVIRRALDEDDLEMTVEAAVDELTNFENRTLWVDSIEKLLDKQENELKIDDYTGVGNDLGNKEVLKKTIEPFKKIAGI